MQQKMGYVIAHTHWDREWRYPIWQTRMLLVDFMDELLDILDNDKKFAGFVTDGQCVLLEDYLQIRPQMRERISKHIKSGKLEIGPWYTLPDLFPIDGECLVRNLMEGHRFCDSLGGKLNIAYTTFGWGQPAQFPQIFDGFDIDFVITGKNISARRAPDCEFWWQSPDGTRILTSRLGKLKRMNFYVNVCIPALHGKNFGDDFKLEWDEKGLVFHSADSENFYKDYFRFENAEDLYDQNLEQNLEKAWQDVQDTLLKDHRVLMSGADYAPPQRSLTKIIDMANQTLEDKKLKMATLTEYAEILKEKIDRTQLVVIEGELRDGPPSGASANALMTRSYIKRLNKKVQSELFHRAEPLSVISEIMGGEYKGTFLGQALKYMLLAHPHDSINGVTQDKTAGDTCHRLEQALEISRVISDDACRKLIEKIDTSDFEPGDIGLLLVNPCAYERDEIVKVCIDTPRDHNVWDFEIVDIDGAALPVQPVSIRENNCPVHDVNLRSYSFPHDRHFVYLQTGQVPAGGYKMLQIKPANRFRRYIQRWPRERESAGDEIATDNRTLENEFLRATVFENGAVEILHKPTDTLLGPCCYLEDTGDVGDYWVHYPPYENQIFTSEGLNARIWLEQNGPLSATIASEILMKIPAYANRPDMGVRGHSKRSTQLTDVTVTTRYTLTKNSPCLDVKLQVKNTAKDHRMRLLLDTGIRAEYAHAAGHFTTDQRPVAPPRNEQGKFHPEMQTLPMQSFVDLSDSKSGLAVISNCFSEYQALNNPNRTLALTLFRSVQNILCSAPRAQAFLPHENGGQSLGLQEYHFAIYPHEHNWQDAHVAKLADQFTVPLSLIQTSRRKGSLPREISFYKIETENIRLSSFKKTRDRDTHILRFYNPTDKAKDVAIRFETKLQHAWITNLNEKRLEQINPSENHVIVKTDPYKIITLELEFEKESMQ